MWRAGNGGEGGPLGLAFYAFPTLEQLSEATEEHLRAEGFGYRFTSAHAHRRSPLKRLVCRALPAYAPA